MGILERARHVVRADLNDLIRKAKNPEVILEAYLDDLHAVQADAESLRAAEWAEREVFEARLRDVQAAQTTWEKKAKSCLKRGDEQLARAALERRLRLNTEREEIRRELEHRSASLAVLDGSLQALKLRIGEVARKQRELRFRRQVLQARSELQKALGRLGDERDEPILADAEDGLFAVESQLEAVEAQDAQSVDRRALTLEAAEQQRQQDRLIDAQLEKLRREIEKEKSR